MAQVIQLHTAKRFMVQEFSAEAFAKAAREIVSLHREPLLDTISVPPGDPHAMSDGELRAATCLHESCCACSLCEEIVLRDLGRES